MAWGTMWTLSTATQFLAHAWIFEMYQWAIMMAALGTIFALSAPVCLLFSWTSNERPLYSEHWEEYGRQTWYSGLGGEFVAFAGIMFQWLLSAGTLFFYGIDTLDWLDSLKDQDLEAEKPERPEEESKFDILKGLTGKEHPHKGDDEEETDNTDSTTDSDAWDSWSNSW